MASRAVSMRIGVGSPFLRSRRATLSPSSPGIATSSTITSGAVRSAWASAAPPSAASVTSYPSADSVRASIRRSGGSSSTTRTRSTTGDVAAQEDQEGRAERRAGEDLPALERAGQHRLERAVVVLGGEDVPCHERGDEREHPHGAEQQDDQRDDQAALGQVRGEREVSSAPAIVAEVDRQ